MVAAARRRIGWQVHTRGAATCRSSFACSFSVLLVCRLTDRALRLIPLSIPSPRPSPSLAPSPPKAPCSQFLVLFAKRRALTFRGLYGIDEGTGAIERLYGERVPPTLVPDMLHGFYKYDSGGKEFREISTGRITATIDAVAIKSEYFANKKRNGGGAGGRGGGRTRGVRSGGFP